MDNFIITGREKCILFICSWPRGLRRGCPAASMLVLWVRIPPGAWMFVVSVVCYQVEVSASGWSLVQRSPTDCGVSECDNESSIVRRPWPSGDVAPWWKTKLSAAIFRHVCCSDQHLTLHARWTCLHTCRLSCKVGISTQTEVTDHCAMKFVQLFSNCDRKTDWHNNRTLCRSAWVRTPFQNK